LIQDDLGDRFATFEGCARMPRLMRKRVDQLRRVTHTTRITRATSRAFALWCTLFVAALFIASCSAIVDSDKTKLGALPVPCDVGQSLSCPCPDGTKSTQLCNSLARFDACSCLGHGGKAGQSGTTNSAGHAGTTPIVAGQGGTAGIAGHAGTPQITAGRGPANH
jgi:hypothetical protein